MEGEHLPKATMNNFVKQQTTQPFSPDFIIRLLGVSKEFVSRVSDRANNVCELASKKTISAEHLETALVELGLEQHTAKLKELGSNIKELNQLKREASQRLEETIEKELKEERQRRNSEQPEKKVVVVRETFEHIDAVNVDKKEDEFDYENIIDSEEQQAVKKDD